MLLLPEELERELVRDTAGILGCEAGALLEERKDEFVLRSCFGVSAETAREVLESSGRAIMFTAWRAPSDRFENAVEEAPSLRAIAPFIYSVLLGKSRRKLLFVVAFLREPDLTNLSATIIQIRPMLETAVALRIAAEESAAFQESVEGAAVELHTTVSKTVHDLRSPLQTMSSAAHILLRRLGERVDPGSNELLQNLLSTTKAMGQRLQEVVEKDAFRKLSQLLTEERQSSPSGR